MKVACIVPPLHLAVNRFGHGYHPPLGLLTVAGPLVDAGFEVHLFDADAAGLGVTEITSRLCHLGADVVLVGHSGSIVSNPAALGLIAKLKAALPHVLTVYGGVYPTYACREIMRVSPGVDFIVCGEGEETTLELLLHLRREIRDFHRVKGLAWRCAGEIVINERRSPIQNLDQFRVAWELADWSLYQSNHSPGRSAVAQFSRGCPHKCTFCGQWKFWETWRHRGIPQFVEELRYLRERHDVRTIWLADENWGCDPAIFRSLLESLAKSEIGMNIFCAMRAEDVLRDADHIQSYRQAGIICLMLGVESLDPRVLERVGKSRSGDVTGRAVALLRAHGMLSVVNVIYGLQGETWRTLGSTLRQMRAMAPDFYNALHVTPLSWTVEGQAIDPRRLVQFDQRNWDFRQPVVQPEHGSPRMLAIAVKLTEALFYLRPLWLARRLTDPDPTIRRIIYDAFFRVMRVYLWEWLRLFRTAYASPGESLKNPDRIALLRPGVANESPQHTPLNGIAQMPSLASPSARAYRWPWAKECYPR